MKDVQHILVPTDFSVEAETALKVAADLARKSGAVIDLLHLEKKSSIQPIQVSRVSNNIRFESTMHEVNHAQLDSLATRKEFDDVKIRISQWTMGESETLSGALGSLIEHVGTDLIVTGTKGLDDFSEFFANSNSAEFLKISDVPVLAVKNYHGPVSYNDIVLALEFDFEEPERYRFIGEFVDSFNSQLHVVTVFEQKDEDIDRETIFKERVRDLCGVIEVKNFSVTSRYAFPIEAGVFDYVKEIDADLLMLGYHLKREEKHSEYGSMAEDFVNHTHLPILTFKI